MRILIHIFFIILFSSCNSSQKIHQPKHHQSWLFTQQEMVGIIPVDENNNPMQKGYWLKHSFIFEVSDTNIIQWNTFSINQQKVIITHQSIKDSISSIGRDKNHQTIPKILPKKGHKLYLINAEDFHNELSLEKSTIYIEGFSMGKTIKIQLLKAPIMLESEIKP
ncbi:MAG: hypothetical protein KGZ59_08185 [Chitinophagaceae bacterium]|nr:hypothetical protein [Chitinophagaceae bacterium]